MSRGSERSRAASGCATIRTTRLAGGSAKSILDLITRASQLLFSLIQTVQVTFDEVVDAARDRVEPMGDGPVGDLSRLVGACRAADRLLRPALVSDGFHDPQEAGQTVDNRFTVTVHIDASGTSQRLLPFAATARCCEQCFASMRVKWRWPHRHVISRPCRVAAW